MTKAQVDNRRALERSGAAVGTWGHLAPARARLISEWAVGRVIDLGCAGDAYTDLLDRAGHVTFGTDVLLPSRPPPRFTIADVTDLPFADHAFDTALLFEVLEHVADVDGALREIGRIAHTLVLTVPNCEQPPEFKAAGLAFHHWTDPTHRTFFDATTLERTLLSAGWTLLDLTPVNPIAPEVLALTSWWMPRRLARPVGFLLKRLPLRRRYHMSLAAIATNSSGGAT